ncbi:MAG: hypothetical protein C5B50_24660 [Verrucomicrobia bacterium]|nr:MAG: hypothetical protein C5B50_24660 [Verrucomicrobiota bacterium]
MRPSAPAMDKTRKETKFMKTSLRTDDLRSGRRAYQPGNVVINRALTGLLALIGLVVTSSFSHAAQGLHVVPSPFIANSTLSGAAIISDNDIWAVGDISGSTASAEATLAEHFDGTAWTVIATPAVNGSMFSSVAGAAGNDVWAVGTQDAGGSGAALIEHWNGASWSVVAGPKLPKGSFLTGVTAISANDAWAVGSEPAPSNSQFIFNPLIEHWNGSSWSVVSSPVLVNGLLLKGISADAANDVWVVGGNTVLHFDGANWTQVSSPSKVSLNTVSALSPGNVWGAGVGPGVYFPRATIEHWNGTAWSVVSSPNPSSRGNSFLEGIAAASANNVWAVGGGTGAGPVTEHWDGQSWTIVATPSGVSSLNGVAARSDGTVVAVGVGTNNSAIILHN